MILGNAYPGILIHPFDHGIAMDPVKPYSYIRALYNLVVCGFIAVAITFTTVYQRRMIEAIKKNISHKTIMYGITAISAVMFLFIVFNLGGIWFQLVLALIMSWLVALAVTYFVKYDEEKNTEGLTTWSIQKAKEMFKGSKLNEREGKIIKVKWKLKEGDDDIINFSKNDMEKMAAEVGDLVYLSDKRKYLGGLKSIHSVYGEPHDEDGLVYITDEHKQSGIFGKDRILTAEKEM